MTDFLELASARPWLRDLILALNGYVESPWAVLLTCFSDDPARLPAKTGYQRLFTSAGAGTLNMPEFFLDMSHGKLDLSGSEVFGWLRLDVPRSTYVGNVYPQPTDKLNRNGLVDAARAKATAEGIDLTRFAGTVVVGYGSTDLCGWVGGMTALCDDNSQTPSLLGQEMGHGYGLDHSMRDGSPDDYNDPWDVMSTAAWPGEMAANKDYTNVGPGLNAWNMRARGWLNESRVATPSVGQTSTIVLRPLHRRELSGYLAADAGPYLIEFRVPEKWDAAIDEPRVFVHRFASNRSFLMAGTKGQWSLGVGDVFRDRLGTVLGLGVRVEVLAIDPKKRTATISVRLTARYRPPDLVASQVFGGIAVDGGGWVIVGGKMVKVPPRGPARDLLLALADYLSVPDTGDVRSAATLRLSLAQAIVGHGIRMADAIELVSHHPPGYESALESPTHGHPPGYEGDQGGHTHEH